MLIGKEFKSRRKWPFPKEGRHTRDEVGRRRGISDEGIENYSHYRPSNNRLEVDLIFKSRKKRRSREKV